MCLSQKEQPAQEDLCTNQTNPSILRGADTVIHQPQSSVKSHSQGSEGCPLDMAVDPEGVPAHVGMFLEKNGHVANEPRNGYERFYEPELGL